LGYEEILPCCDPAGCAEKHRSLQAPAARTSARATAERTERLKDSYPSTGPSRSGACRAWLLLSEDFERKTRRVPPRVPDWLERTVSKRLGPTYVSGGTRSQRRSKTLISSGSERSSGCRPTTTSSADENEYEKGVKYGFHGGASFEPAQPRSTPQRTYVRYCTIHLSQWRTVHNLARAARDREKVRPPGRRKSDIRVLGCAARA
jgi:hypothetical protein